MPLKKTSPECSFRIALVLDLSTLIGNDLLSGLCQRATVHPLLMVRRFFTTQLLEKGMDVLVDWKPDALVVYTGTTTLVQNLRKTLPHAPMVAMNSRYIDLADAIVVVNSKEMIDLSLDHFSSNGLTNFAVFYTIASKIDNSQKDIFRQLLHKRSGTSYFFQCDLYVEEMVSPPEGELLEKIGAWLKSLPKPVGIYCATAHSAAYLARICKHVGLAVPRDIQLIGIDELDESIECLPHISSIHFPVKSLGALALETAINLLHGKKMKTKIQYVNGLSIVPRGSTGIIHSLLSNIPAAIAYIESRATQGATVDEVLMETQNVCRMTFYREFKEQIGELPAKYIRRVRFETACRLLATTSLKITQISELSGFSSSTYFAQMFRRDIEMTPKQYRKSRKGQCGAK